MQVLISSFLFYFRTKTTADCNHCNSVTVDVSSALFTLSFIIPILNTKCEEGATDVNDILVTAVTFGQDPPKFGDQISKGGLECSLEINCSACSVLGRNL